MIPVARRFADENHLIGKAMQATEENLRAAGNQPAIFEKCAVTEILESEPEISDSPESAGN